MGLANSNSFMWSVVKLDKSCETRHILDRKSKSRVLIIIISIIIIKFFLIKKTQRKPTQSRKEIPKRLQITPHHDGGEGLNVSA
jgi:hypothetical protein